MEVRKVLAGKISVSSFSIVLLYFAFIAIICSLLKRVEESRTRLLLALSIMFFSVVARIIWISMFDSYQISDFAYYYKCGQEIAEGQSNLCGLSLFWMRSLFYTAPISFLFGNSLSALEFVNVFIFLVALTFFFITGWVVFGVEVAVIALLIFSFYPDYWYPMTLASHDNTGILWLSVFFLSFIILQRLIERSVFKVKPVIAVSSVSVFMGFVLMMLKYTRSYHYPAILVCFLFFVFYNFKSNVFSTLSLTEKAKKLGFSLVIIIIIPLSVYNSMHYALNKGFDRSKTKIDKLSSLSGLASITAVNIEGWGSHLERLHWSFLQYPKINKKERFGFALRKFLHEWTYDIGKTIRHLMRKNRYLGSAYGNFYYASRTEPEFRWDTSKEQVKRINNSTLGLQREIISLLNMFIYAVVLIRLLLAPWLPFKYEEFSILVFSASAFLMLLLLGEAQPRYTLFLVFPFSYFFGQAVWFSLNSKRQLSLRSPFFPERKVLITSLSIFIAAIVLFLCLSKAVSYSGWILEDLSDARSMTAKEVKKIVGGESDHIIEGRIDAFFNKIAIRYSKGSTIEAGSVMGARKAWKQTVSNKKNMAFFLTIAPNDYQKPRDYIRPKELTWKKYGVSYSVLLNGQAVYSGNVSKFHSEFIILDIRPYPGDGFLNLDVLVFNDKVISRQKISDDPLLILEHVRLY